MSYVRDRQRIQESVDLLAERNREQLLASVAEGLNGALRAQDLTQSDVAHTLGMSDSNLSKALKGDPGVGLNLLTRVAAALGMRLVVMLEQIE